jgi:hypothetical protein
MYTTYLILIGCQPKNKYDKIQVYSLSNKVLKAVMCCEKRKRVSNGGWDGTVGGQMG